MTCDEFLRAIDAYLDDELSVMDILRVHGHLLSCELCRRVMGSEATLHSVLADDAARLQPPGSLRERILERVAIQAGAGAPGAPSERRSRIGPLISLSAVLAAALLVGLLLLVPSILGRGGRTALTPLAAELAAKHLLYSGGEGTALEMRTSESSRMTDWLEPRIGLSLKLPPLDRPDDRLVGGRVSTIADTPAAYVLYELAGRRISLFVTRPMPGGTRGVSEKIIDGAELYTAALRGVALAWWEDEDEGRLYAAASTGDPAELRQFALLCIRSRQAVKPGRPWRRSGSGPCGRNQSKE
jgi:anti-sigma factor RsiW